MSSHQPVYISLDLETTGFDPHNDQVIEIAAIKFQGREILEQYETMINPGVPIPEMVSHITGITNETVQEAPDFSTIKKDLLKFLGDHPIVGHNIDFDLTFLKAKGLPLINKQFDTLILSSIFLPGLPSYSLDTISRELKLTHLQKHRALSDAHVCFDLFNIIREKISEIPAPILSRIQNLLPRSNWPLAELFSQTHPSPPLNRGRRTEDEGANLKRAISSQGTEVKPSAPSTLTQPLDFNITSTEKLEELFSPDTPLGKIIPDFEVRPGQKKLTEQILEAFKHGFHLLAEAGTGTGKSFAYLLAAAFFSTKYNQKVVISTYTNTLQDQLIQKEIPIIKALFPKLKTAVLKGKNRYLSQHRLNQLINKDYLEDHEVSTIIKILLWLPQTETGDLDELNLQNKELNVLDLICVQNGDHRQPEPQSTAANFYEKARLQANQANLIIVNHALLLQNTRLKNSLLPDYNYLVIDEAHHLEKVTTDTLTINLTPNRLKKTLDEMILLCETSSETNLFNLHLNPQLLQSIVAECDSCSILNQDVFIVVKAALDQLGKNLNVFQQYISFNSSFAESPTFHELKLKLQSLGENVDRLVTSINNNFDQLLEHFDQRKRDDFNWTVDHLVEIQEEIKILKLLDLKEKIIWISKTFDENIHFNCVDLNIASFLKEKLFSKLKTGILTSATLTTNNDFSFIRHELSLGEEFNELTLPSYFSYPDQVKIIIPEDLPEPKNEDYLHECSVLIENIIVKNEGRALILFTAKKDLGRTFHEIAPRLKKVGINLLAQGITGGRGKILSHFRDEPEACAILGLNSFWEGVDLIGDDLNCLVIQKLPFDPPDDPILSSRAQKYSDPFRDFTLPRAILRFKQGFGRLIRSANDTGKVIILDSRLVTKDYGQFFLNSLPSGIKIVQCPKSQLPNYL